MKFRSLPPDPAEFPRARLVLPIFVPAALVSLGWLASEWGHEWNLHGDGAVLMGAIVLSLVAAICVVAHGFVSGARALVAHPSLRSRANVASLAFAGVVLALFLAGLVREFAGPAGAERRASRLGYSVESRISHGHGLPARGTEGM